MSGWKLRDEGSTEFIIKGKTIEAYSRQAFFITETKITLNNSGDSVQLINPNGEAVDESTNYGSAEEGLSWSYIGSSWQWAIAATPGSSNAAIYIDTSAAGSVEAIKKATTKKKAKTKASTKKPKASKLKTSAANSSSSQPGYDSKQSGTATGSMVELVACRCGSGYHRVWNL